MPLNIRQYNHLIKRIVLLERIDIEALEMK